MRISWVQFGLSACLALVTAESQPIHSINESIRAQIESDTPKELGWSPERIVIEIDPTVNLPPCEFLLVSSDPPHGSHWISLEYAVLPDGKLANGSDRAIQILSSCGNQNLESASSWAEVIARWGNTQATGKVQHDESWNVSEFLSAGGRVFESPQLQVLDERVLVTFFQWDFQGQVAWYNEAVWDRATRGLSVRVTDIRLPK
jgi:hypothetical protein